jgi:hypothetical protein
MEVSDSEDEPQRKKIRNQSICNDDSERLQILKEENDSLRCQLEAYKNEVNLLFINLYQLIHYYFFHEYVSIISVYKTFSKTFNKTFLNFIEIN